MTRAARTVGRAAAPGTPPTAAPLGAPTGAHTPVRGAATDTVPPGRGPAGGTPAAAAPTGSHSAALPHPAGGGFVGTYVHSYDPTRQPYQSHIPAMRPAQDMRSGFSETPIYDALYSEWRRSFRALPGDRSNEENLGFTAFGTGLHAAHSGYGGYGNHGDHGHTAYLGSWQRDTRQPTGRHLPALPPGPRRGI